VLEGDAGAVVPLELKGCPGRTEACCGENRGAASEGTVDRSPLQWPPPPPPAFEVASRTCSWVILVSLAPKKHRATVSRPWEGKPRCEPLVPCGRGSLGQQGSRRQRTTTCGTEELTSSATRSARRPSQSQVRMARFRVVGELGHLPHHGGLYLKI
jgi:hypothetical protein